MARAGNMVGGKYRLTDLIGEGSMGSVWRAVHETLSRPFAVKFLKDYGPPAALLEERFLNEARLAAAVRHRFVVDTVDFGITDEGTPYMVMEYLSGESLATRLASPEPMPVDALLTIMEKALTGLEAVHQAGVIHRDFKPENIVLCPEVGGLVPKLVDFGISRAQDSQVAGFVGPGGTRLTLPGMAMGTPWYMAPEQVQALSTIDSRADIYAAGVILYEALNGTPPFDSDKTEVLMLLVARGDPAPLEEYRPDLPAELLAAVTRAMARDPAERFAGAAELAAALAAVVPQLAPDVMCRQRQVRRRTRWSLSVPGQDILADAKAAPCRDADACGERAPTLRAPLARQGVLRTPARRWLIAASALAITASLGLMVVLGADGGSAGAHPKPITPESARLAPRDKPPAAAAAAPVPGQVSVRQSQIGGRPAARSRKPPEIFRHPGF